MADIPPPPSPQERSLGKVAPPVLHSASQSKEERLSQINLDVRQEMAKGARASVPRLLQIAEGENIGHALQAIKIFCSFGPGTTQEVILKDWSLLTVVLNTAVSFLMEPLSEQALKEGTRMSEDEMIEFKRAIMKLLPAG